MYTLLCILTKVNTLLCILTKVNTLLCIFSQTVNTLVFKNLVNKKFERPFGSNFLSTKFFVNQFFRRLKFLLTKFLESLFSLKNQTAESRLSKAVWKSSWYIYDEHSMVVLRSKNTFLNVKEYNFGHERTCAQIYCRPNLLSPKWVQIFCPNFSCSNILRPKF